VVSVRPVLDRWPAFRDLLLEDHEEKFTSLRGAEGIGRPLGTADFVTELECRLGRSIAARPRMKGRGDPGGRAVGSAALDVTVLAPMRPRAVRRALVTRFSVQARSTSAKRRAIWFQLVPLRALLDSPTSTRRRFKVCRVAPTMQCGPGPMMLPKAASSCKRMASAAPQCAGPRCARLLRRGHRGCICRIRICGCAAARGGCCCWRKGCGGAESGSGSGIGLGDAVIGGKAGSGAAGLVACSEGRSAWIRSCVCCSISARVGGLGWGMPILRFRISGFRSSIRHAYGC
jgi:hypothetical protein